MGTSPYTGLPGLPLQVCRGLQLWPGSHRGQALAASASASGLGEAVKSPELVHLVERLFISSPSSPPAPPKPPLLIPGPWLLSLCLELSLHPGTLSGAWEGGLAAVKVTLPPRTCPWSRWTDWGPDSVSSVRFSGPWAHQGSSREEFGGQGRPAPHSQHPSEQHLKGTHSSLCLVPGGEWRGLGWRGSAGEGTWVRGPVRQGLPETQPRATGGGGPGT